MWPVRQTLIVLDRVPLVITILTSLAFGKINENVDFKSKIKELVTKSLGEAKKKKKDVIEPEPIDEPQDETTPEVEDTIAPDHSANVDIDPKVKSVQDSLQKAYANAKALGDEKLVAQIGNTITMLVRTQVLGGHPLAEGVVDESTSNLDKIFLQIASKHSLILDEIDEPIFLKCMDEAYKLGEGNVY